jgi:putative transposase
VRYRLLAWVIMPTHVHACFALHPGWPLEKVIFSWKRQSARAINQARWRDRFTVAA